MVQLVTGAVAAGSSSASEPQTTELPAIEVFESARTNFRMRASFQIWREGAGLHYVMFNRGDSRTPHEVPTLTLGAAPTLGTLPELTASLPRASARPRRAVHGVVTAGGVSTGEDVPDGLSEAQRADGPADRGAGGEGGAVPGRDDASSAREGRCVD